MRKHWLHADKNAIGSMSVLAIFIVATLLISGLAYMFLFKEPGGETEKIVVQREDIIEVDYIGMFENGLVFDTSLESVANNDALYPKALSFEKRAEGEYEPLNFTVGQGQMVKGFEMGVIGMQANETKTLTLSPEEAYGLSNPDLIEVSPLIQEFKVKMTMNETVFASKYDRPPLYEGEVFMDPVNKWNVTVFSIDREKDEVMVYNEPFLYQKVNMQDAWESEIIYVNSSDNSGDGLIKVHHKLTKDDAGKIRGFSPNGEFIVTEVDEEAGTFTVDYNREVVGKTLIFKVTVVQIYKKPKTFTPAEETEEGGEETP